MNTVPPAITQLYEHIDSPTFLRDASRRVVYMNPAAERQLGARREELIGKDCAELFSEEELDCSTQCPYTEEEFMDVNPHGFSVCIIQRIISDGAGGSLTVMKRPSPWDAPISLGELIETVSAPVVVITDAGNIAATNESLRTITGMENVAGFPVTDIMPGFDHAPHLQQPGSPPFRQSVNLAGQDGISVVSASSRVTVMPNTDAHLAVITLDQPTTTQVINDDSQTYRTITENASTGIILYRETIEYANPFVMRITGLPPESLARMSVVDIFQAEYQPLVRTAVKKRLSGEPFPGTYEARIMDTDGRERWVLVNGSTVQMDDGPAGLIYLVDITLRKTLEKKLRESERLFKTLSEYATFGVVVYQQDIIYANSACVEMTGYSKMELYRMPFSELIHEDDREESTINARRHLDSEQLVTHLDKRLITKDGDTRWIRAYLSGITYNGVPSGIVSFIDVTREKELQQSLRKSETLFKTLADNATIGIFISNEDLGILYANPCMADVIGLPAERITNLSVLESMIVENIEGLKDIQMTTVDEFTIPRLQEFQLLTPENKHIWIELQLTAVDLAEETVMLGSIVDVTDRHRYEQHLVSLNHDLEQEVIEATRTLDKREQMLIQQSKLATMGEMLGAIAHQWRQPLNGLSIMIQNLRTAQRMGKLNTDLTHEIVEECLASIAFMSNTINDFREFFKPVRQVSDFCVATVIRESLSIFRPQLTNSGVGISVQIQSAPGAEPQEVCSGEAFDAAESLRVFGYPSELKQVMLNLLANSRDAIIARRETGGHSNLVGMIIITLMPEGNERIRMTLEDNGHGIAQDIIDKVFDAYFTTKEDKDGTGIGLYMSRTIIEKNMGGTIAVENTATGARFTIALPLVKPEASNDGS